MVLNSFIRLLKLFKIELVLKITQLLVFIIHSIADVRVRAREALILINIVYGVCCSSYCQMSSDSARSGEEGASTVEMKGDP
jgi:hypothetical protein